MKSKFTFLLLLTFFTVISYEIYTESNTAHSRTTGGPAGHSGDPSNGNKTCNIAGCHTGPTPIAINGLISSNVPAAGYTPGSTYTFTASISRSGHTKFGFQATPQNATGALLGSLIATSTQTQLVGTNKYITHTSGGTSGNGSKSWTFDWTAPSSGTGNVTFYSAFNASNSNSSASGDSIFTSTITIPENTALGVNQIASKEIKLTVYPNPVAEKLNISFTTEENQEVEITLCDLQGKVADKLYSGFSITHNFSASFELDHKYPAGIYLLKIKSGTIETTKKIVIE